MSLSILRLTPHDAALLEVFLLADGGEAAVAGLRAARARHDLLAADTFWLLLAVVDGQPAGLAAVALVPKADARGGFLFVDELTVLPAYRRRGVATALLRQVIDTAAALGLAGVRLLVRPDNAAARQLYAALGFDEHATLLCQRRIGP